MFVVKSNDNKMNFAIFFFFLPILSMLVTLQVQVAAYDEEKKFIKYQLAVVFERLFSIEPNLRLEPNDTIEQMKLALSLGKDYFDGQDDGWLASGSTSFASFSADFSETIDQNEEQAREQDLRDTLVLINKMIQLCLPNEGRCFHSDFLKEYSKFSRRELWPRNFMGSHMQFSSEKEREEFMTNAFNCMQFCKQKQIETCEKYMAKAVSREVSGLDKSTRKNLELLHLFWLGTLGEPDAKRFSSTIVNVIDSGSFEPLPISRGELAKIGEKVKFENAFERLIVKPCNILLFRLKSTLDQYQNVIKHFVTMPDSTKDWLRATQACERILKDPETNVKRAYKSALAARSITSKFMNVILAKISNNNNLSATTTTRKPKAQ